MKLAVLGVLLLLLPITPLAGASPVHEYRQASQSLIPKQIDANETGLAPKSEVDVTAAYDKEPAPLGIADYGVNANGPYEYSTNSSLGVAAILGLAAQNATGSPDISMQLNVNLKFTAGGKLYVYWIQDVAFMDTSNESIVFVDNVWNFSSKVSALSSSGLSGDGQVMPAGAESYYGFVAPVTLSGNNVALTLPGAVALEVDASVSASGQPVVYFSYDDGTGLQTYDAVTFLTVGKLVMPGFTVDGSGYNPLGTFYDSEFIIGGPGDGLSSKDVSSNVHMRLYFFNGHNYEIVPNAYNFGSDTAETIGNTLSRWFYVPANGENIAEIQAGAGTLGQLYNSSEVGTIDYASTVGSGTLEVQNSTDTTASPDQYPFIGGRATVTVYPGEYTLQLLVNGTLTSLGTFLVAPGQTVDISSPTTSTTQLTLSYSVQGGGSGYSSPMLTYTLGGKQETIPLTTTPTEYTMDNGSAWSVSVTLPGSSSSERWATDQTTSGNADSQSIQFVYQNQYMVLVDYSVIGGGSPPAPEFEYDAFSFPTFIFLTNSPASFWMDSGSSYSLPLQLGGSSSSERWQTLTDSGVVQGSTPIVFAYYHQFFITPLYLVQGGGSGYGNPAISCPLFGTQTSAAEGGSQWADAGSSCVYPATLTGSSQGARWAISSPDVAVIDSGAVTGIYYYQYSLEVTLSVIGGAPPSPPALSGVSFGTSSTIPISSPVQEWLDVGSPYSLSNPTPSSTASDRWYTNAQTSGVLGSSGTVSATYYHQYLVTVQYKVVGGGSPPAPSVTYTSFGSPASLSLTTIPQSAWVDSGSHYSVPALLSGSAAGERWSSSSTSGTAQGPATLALTYYHEFLLSARGAGLTPQWYNASSTATVSVADVTGRSSGSGQRTTSYSVDGAAAIVVKPTASNITISITMDGPRTLAINSVTQYEVTIGASISGAMSSVTPPTIVGDALWYDQGTNVSLAFNGVWNRSAGTGERLASYSVDNVSHDSDTAGSVDVQLGPITSPVSISGTVVKQYSLNTGTGSIKSETQPTISGDTGWYDSRTPVSVAYYYSWDNLTGTSRDNALSYSINGAVTKLTRSGVGTFTVQATMSAPETIAVLSVVQYSLAVSGGNNPSTSLSSPTGDDFYDAGSNLTVSIPYTWGLTGGNTRSNLASFTLDSVMTNVTREQNGTFTTPGIVFSSPHILAFNAVTQYLVAFQFKDSTGSSSIAPTSVQIEVDDPTVVSIPASGAWLDNGTKFQLYDVEWESTDVKPTNQTVYTADAPLNQTVLDQVYSGTIDTKDYLGLAVSGAQVSVTLANGTTISRTTGSDGTVHLDEIPGGVYNATISYIGTKTTLEGNLASGLGDQARVPLSYPTFGLIAALVAVAVIALFAVSRRRHSWQDSTPLETVGEPETGQTSSAPGITLCPKCDSPNTNSAESCDSCGQRLH